MRRLQGNLTYMAALADRKGGQVPECPAHLMPPPLNLSIKMKASPAMQGESPEKQVDPNVDREERDKLLKDLYKQLQALFPGIDPRKEPAYQVPPNARGPGQQQINQRPMGGNPQGSPPPPNQMQRPGQMAPQAMVGS
jgi:hypothetical protein